MNNQMVIKREGNKFIIEGLVDHPVFGFSTYEAARDVLRDLLGEHLVPNEYVTACSRSEGIKQSNEADTLYNIML